MRLQLQRGTWWFIGLLAAGASVVLAGVLWWHQPAHHAARIDPSPFETDMIETLVRGMLQENSLREAPVCFVSFGAGGTSPSAGFLARFADCRHPSVCGQGSSVSPLSNRYFEKANGRPGIVIQIIKFSEYIPTVFDVTVSLSNLPHGHDQVVYRISQIAGNWAIQHRTPS